MKRIAISIVMCCATGLAAAQANPQDHAAHHPEAAAAAPGPYERQMQSMQDMHKRMQAAKTPAEKEALMAEHMKLMQSSMDMMSRMGREGAAPMPMEGMGGMGGMGGMMARHAAMERRMAMMEQMMQMMVDREAAMPRR
jgi:hypothetical protein